MFYKLFRVAILLLLVGAVFSGLAASAEPVAASGSFGKKTPANGAEFSLAEMQSKLGARFWWLYAGNFPHEYCISTVDGSCNTQWVDAKDKMYVYYADLNLQPGTTYYWQVRALIYGEYIYADAGNWWQFKVLADSAPTGFVKSSPANGASFHRADFKDKWGARLWWKPAGSTIHEVCFVKAPDTCDPNNPAKWTDTNGKLYAHYDPYSLEVGETYSWQVRAISNEQYIYANGTSGAVWSFTILPDPAPTPFGKTSPGNAIEFSRGYFKDNLGSRLWWKSAGSVPYEYCFSTVAGDCAQGSAAINWTDSKGKLYYYHDHLDLQIGTTYYWQIRALINENYVYADAGPWSFTVVADTAPVGFGKSSPPNNDFLSRGDFQSKYGSRLWWGSAGSVPYEICFVKSPSVCDPNNAALWRDTKGKLYDHHDHMSLEIGETYVWQVRALISGQYIYANNQAWQFTVVADAAPASLKKSSPANGISFSHRDINEKLNNGRFWWGSTGTADYYEYRFFREAVGSCPSAWNSGWVNSNGKLYVHHEDLQLVPDCTYFWQVRAHINGQDLEADGGTWWSFEVIP
jgi:hypothetical protein